MQKISLNNLHRTSSQFLNQLQPDAHGAMVRVEPLSQVIVIEAVIVFSLLLWTTVHIWAKSPWIVSQASQLVVVVVDSLPCVLCLGQLHQEFLHPSGYQWILMNSFLFNVNLSKAVSSRDPRKSSMSTPLSSWNANASTELSMIAT